MFNWIAFIIWTVLFLFFLLGFLYHKKRPEWKSSGVVIGFIIALFAEMFGLPLSIYIISSLIGVSDIPGSDNLRFVLIGTTPIQLFFVLVAILLLSIGFLLMGIGWYKIYNAKDSLVTNNIYAYVRHPQYLGLLMITLGLLVWWPTIVILIMWPILCIMYYFLAKREEKEMINKFGSEYLQYKQKVNMFIPIRKSIRNEM